MLNWIDKTIAVFSPGTAQERAKSRLLLMQMEMVARSFDAASKAPRLSGWRRPATSAAAASLGKLSTLRSGSRDLSRNNPWAKKAVATLKGNVVGTGVIGRPEHKIETLHDMHEALWRDWSGKVACDADGLHTLYGLQKKAFECIVESGEVIIRRRRRRLSDRREIPWQLQVLEPDFIDDHRDGDLPNGNRIVQGIEFNSIGERVAYYLFDQHPGDTFGRASPQSRRIPAADIIHAFEANRPGQVRGIPWAAPVMIRLHDFKDYEDAQLVRQKLSACFTAFIYDMEPPNNATGLTAPGIGVEGKKNGVEALQPGLMEYLPPGKDIKFSNPPGVTGYAEYSTATLRAIAAGYRVPYEAVSGDYSQVNYSSARMAWLEYRRYIRDWQQDIMITMICQRIEEWWLEGLSVIGRPTDGLTMKWTPPRQEMIDPDKDGKAMKEARRNGLASLKTLAAELGMDFYDLMADIKEENDFLDTNGILLDSDARNADGKGAGRPPEENATSKGKQKQPA
ncbi:phage portal protein [Nostoc linckia]|uniref:phage portal protein n=1 Tax=Nostoc linckia TaxID=92942 RepID=UPI000BFFF73D|nr:phage portal protein [Nostoc linckia]